MLIMSSARNRHAVIARAPVVSACSSILLSRRRYLQTLLLLATTPVLPEDHRCHQHDMLEAKITAVIRRS
jgi:hypothetical protein